MARRLPPLNGLRAFEAAARHRSFTAAAAELNVTPAAVSHQVKGLEGFLGVPLFRRLHRGLVLTDAGLAYQPELSKAFDHLARAGQALPKGPPRGNLAVTTLPSFGHMWLAPRLPAFLDMYPDIDVTVYFEDHQVDFATTERDLGIRYGAGRYPDLFSVQLMTEEVFPVCSPTLLNGPRPLRTPRDLAHHTLIHDHAPGRLEPTLDWAPWLRDAGLDEAVYRRGPRFTDTAAIIHLTMAGHGVALGRSALVAEFLDAGRLVRPLAVSRPAVYAYYLVAPPPVAAEPKVAAFIDWITEVAETASGHA
ncbi:MAG: transcriptional regulator GcvA [Hyphomicrobiales bacterium]|nr:transcriptional regulator GcvA [Hyphomicrobiales bacterium]MCP5373167.1 transcriptional regulator GcvA [Hyphomicrobiales bacterium]